MKKNKNDGVLVAAVTALLIIGMIMVLSASAILSDLKHHTILFFYGKQILWAFLCMFMIFIFSRVDYNSLAKRWLPISWVMVSIVLLAAVLKFGIPINGARRWFVIGPVNFQPSELAKIVLIIYFADIFTRKSEALQEWKKLIPHALILGIALVLIFIEPDLSQSLMIAVLIVIMAFLSNIQIKHIFGAAVMLIPVLFIRFQLAGYQMGRISSYLNSFGKPLGTIQQTNQSLIGLGSGGFFGAGLGNSTQKFLFLPDSHTDFIFSVVGEEFGFLGTTVVLLLFLAILWRGIRIAKYAPNPFGQILAVGLTVNIVMYAFVHAGVVTMLLPTTGLSMPFMSYGGTSLLFTGMSIGILMSIARQCNSSALDERLTQLENNRDQVYSKLIMSR